MVAQIPDVVLTLKWDASSERVIREARAVLLADNDDADAADAGRKLTQSVLALVDLTAMQAERKQFSYDPSEAADAEGEAEEAEPDTEGEPEDIYDVARAEARAILQQEIDPEAGQGIRLPSDTPSQ